MNEYIDNLNQLIRANSQNNFPGRVIKNIEIYHAPKSGETVELISTSTTLMINNIVITEIGGTVGDIESLPYIEAVRQIKWEMGHKVMVIHLTLVPFLAATGELKTKPTQHSVKALLETGVQPEVLVPPVVLASE